MGGELIAGIIQGAVGGTIDIVNFFRGIEKDSYNRRSEEENQQYQRSMNALALNREDNAVQRRAADMAAAGINPIMAAGSPAQSMAPVSSTAPRSEASQMEKSDFLGSVIAGAQLKQMDADYKRTLMETKMKSQEIKLAKRDSERKDVELGIAQTRSQEQSKMFPYQIDSIKNDIAMFEHQVRSMGYENALRDVNARLAEAHISGAQLDNARKKLENTGINTRLSAEYYDMLIKEVALDLARLNFKERRRNIGIYSEAHLPSDSGLTASERLALLISDNNYNVQQYRAEQKAAGESAKPPHYPLQPPR
jgi:hypothetical protein